MDTKFVELFEVQGNLIGARQLKSEKSPDWKCYIYKVALLGKTLEVQSDSPSLFTQMEVAKASQAVVNFAGTFDEYNGRLKLVAQSGSILPLNGKK